MDLTNSSPSASRVKIYPWLGHNGGLARALAAAYSTKQCELLGKFDLSSSSLRTYVTYYPSKKGRLSKKCSTKLPRQGIMLNGALYQHKMWEPVIKESGSGSLPTPNTMDHLPPRGLDSMIKQTQIHRKGRKKLSNLREAVNPDTVALFNKLQSLPTPTANMWKGVGKAGSKSSLSFFKKKYLIGILNEVCSPPTGEATHLNPSFCEEMLGLPIGWTDLNA
tara:strand:+ start:435 stop:1097 length:663 start_codon:yes stop_codon:yes gene_type:complete